MLKLFTSNIKIIISIVLVILFALIAYTIFKRVKGGADAIGSLVADKAEDVAISQTLKVPVARVKVLRNAAYAIADELETRKGMSWITKLQQMTDDEELYLNLNEAESIDEMKVIKALYKSEFTEYRDLWNDLSSELITFKPTKVKYIAGLY